MPFCLHAVDIPVLDGQVLGFAVLSYIAATRTAMPGRATFTSISPAQQLESGTLHSKVCLI